MSKKDILLEDDFGKLRIWKNGEECLNLRISKTKSNYDLVSKILKFVLDDGEYIDMVNSYDYDRHFTKE